MKKLIKKQHDKMKHVVSAILKELKNNSSFFYSHNKNKRFAAPINLILYGKFNNITSDEIVVEFAIMKSLLNIIDSNGAVVSFKDDTGTIMFFECNTFSDPLTAVKVAKKGMYEHVVDLKTGKILKTNG